MAPLDGTVRVSEGAVSVHICADLIVRRDAAQEGHDLCFLVEPTPPGTRLISCLGCHRRRWTKRATLSSKKMRTRVRGLS